MGYQKAKKLVNIMRTKGLLYTASLELASPQPGQKALCFTFVVQENGMQ